jgi:MFS family permease
LSRMAWIVVAVLMPVALLNYLDRQMLASMKDSVMHDIPSIALEENWGYMLGQFKWVYAVFSLLGGYLADRFSRRSTICTSLFVWSVVTWMTGRVTNYDQLLIVRSLMGISEAFYIPAALALIADYHSGHTRSRAIGFHQMAIYCGVIMGGFGGYVADDANLGWRFAFTSCGIFGMIYSLPLLLILRDASTLKESMDVPQTSARRAAVELLTNFSFILLVLYFTLPALAGWVIRDWMPAILKNEFHISQGRAGVAATLYWQAAAIVGAIVGGALADGWVEWNDRGRIFVSAIGMGMIVPAICGIGLAPTIYVAVAFLMLFGVGWGFFDCNNMPILSQIVRPHLRATGYGIMNFLSISGGGLADWGFGILRDRHVPISLIFGVVAGASLFSILLVLLIRPNIHLFTQDQLE